MTATTWEVQVKATSASHGGIAWRKPGDKASDWAKAARDRGATDAFFVFAQINEPGTYNFDLTKGRLIIDTPKKYALVAATADQFAHDVDQSRDTYRQTERKRGGRNGEKVGDFLSAENLQYPVTTGEYPPLADFIKTL